MIIILMSGYDYVDCNSVLRLGLVQDFIAKDFLNYKKFIKTTKGIIKTVKLYECKRGMVV